MDQRSHRKKKGKLEATFGKQQSMYEEYKAHLNKEHPTGWRAKVLNRAEMKVRRKKQKSVSGLVGLI